MNNSLSLHADKRLKERTEMSESDLFLLLTEGLYTPIGFNKHKKHVMNKLVYHFPQDEFFIISQDNEDDTIITILKGKEFRSWYIDLDVFLRLKALVINSYLNKDDSLVLSSKDILELNKEFLLEEYPKIKDYLISNFVKLNINYEHKKMLETELNNTLLEKKIKNISEENIKNLENKEKDNNFKVEYKNPIDIDRIKTVISNNECYEFIEELCDYILVELKDIGIEDYGFVNLRRKYHKNNCIKIEKSSALIYSFDASEVSFLIDYINSNYENSSNLQKKGINSFLNKHGYKGLNKRVLSEKIYYILIK